MTTAPRRFVFAVVVGLLLIASPAAADPAGPTHFRSTVTTVTELGADEDVSIPVSVSVLGGDAFLVVAAASGSEVQVAGYEGEPYLRIAADGTVELNVRSPARWLNDARFGEAEVEVPPQADPDAPPQWETVASDGRYAWHDHRIHFMSPALPPSVDGSADAVQPVLDWEVPMIVDGRDVIATGDLVWIPGPSPVIPIAIVVLAVVGGALVALRRPSALSALIAAGAVVMGAVGIASSVGLPAGAEAAPALLVLPGMTLAVLLFGRAWSRRDARLAAWIVPAAGLPAAVWTALQFGALTRPIVPSLAPTALVRGAVGVALAVAIACLVALIRQVLAATALDPQPTEAPGA